MLLNYVKLHQFQFKYRQRPFWTGLVETVLVETTVLVDQKTLTMQFYLLSVESSL